MQNSKNDRIMINVRNLTFHYPRKPPILQNVTFSINSGEIIGIVGMNGTGKTTLGYILKGIIPQTIKGKLSGEIKIAGINIPKTKLSKLAKVVGMVFQDINSQIFNPTVKDEIEFGLKNLAIDLSWSQKVMKSLEIQSIANENPLNLSIGQKKKVILGSIIAMHPKVLILDEPTVHLDKKSKVSLINLIQQVHHDFNTTLLIIEQDPEILGALCEKLLVIEESSIELVPKSNLLVKEKSWTWK